jgi:hypothetical protein
MVLIKRFTSLNERSAMFLFVLPIDHPARSAREFSRMVQEESILLAVIPSAAEADFREGFGRQGLSPALPKAGRGTSYRPRNAVRTTER